MQGTLKNVYQNTDVVITSWWSRISQEVIRYGDSLTLSFKSRGRILVLNLNLYYFIKETVEDLCHNYIHIPHFQLWGCYKSLNLIADQFSVLMD